MAAANPLSFITLAQRLNLEPEVWAAMAWQLICELRVALPCIVDSFDSVKQTVRVHPTIQENILQNLVVTQEDLPQLLDVPVVFPRAGGYNLSFPIKPGDECLVIFADMCYNAWWQNGAATQNQVQETKRRHDLSDGIAIFGLWSQPRKLPSYSQTAVQLRSDDGATMIEIDGKDITVLAPDAGSISVTAQGSSKITLQSDTEIDITAPTVKINGTTLVDISGGNSKIDGKVFLTHKHTGVQTGGGNTGNVL